VWKGRPKHAGGQTVNRAELVERLFDNARLRVSKCRHFTALRLLAGSQFGAQGARLVGSKGGLCDSDNWRGRNGGAMEAEAAMSGEGPRKQGLTH